MSHDYDYDDLDISKPDMPVAMKMLLAALAITLALAGGVVAVVVILSRDSGQATQRQAGGPAGERTATVGGVEVLGVQCQVREVAGFRFGEYVRYGNQAIIELRLRNTSPTKLARLAGWQDADGVIVQDEYGNTYKPLGVPSGFGFAVMPNAPTAARDGCDCDSIIARNLSLHPERCYITFLLYEPPIANAKELRLTLPAESLGGNRPINVRVPIVN